MKKILSLFGYKVKYRVVKVKVGVKDRFQIQSTILGFTWKKVMNPLLKNQSVPYEFKFAQDAEKVKAKLQSVE
jgi:hypothetical protein